MISSKRKIVQVPVNFEYYRGKFVKTVETSSATGSNV
jgi:hypothetical protein